MVGTALELLVRIQPSTWHANLASMRYSLMIIAMSVNLLLLKSYKLTRVYGTGPCLILLSILPNHQHTWIKVEEQRWLLINNLVCSWVRVSLFLSTSHLLFLTHSFILNLACSLSVSQSLTHSHSLFLAPSFSLTKFPVSHFYQKIESSLKFSIQ